MDELELLLLLALHLVLTGLPGAAAALLAPALGERPAPVLLGIGLVGSGAAAMIVFWAYYGGHELGQTASFFFAIGSALVVAWALRDGGIDRGLLRRLAVPVCLWALGSGFILYFGFLHGGTEHALSVSSKRFAGQMPTDNDIPLFFAEWFYAHGHHGTPPVFPGEWIASDRPPLLMGYVNFERPFGWDSTALHYEVIGLVTQQLWIVGLWALLVAGRVGRVTRGLAVLTVLISDVGIVNSFYVWPKLLPAAMLLGAAALILTPLWKEVRGSLWGSALVAALLALALLGHGASVFGVIPLVIVAAFRGLPGWRWLGVALLTLVVFYAPWSAYQKWGDPPGNRLTKWFLAGELEISNRSVGDAIRTAYSEAGFGGTLHNKAENFVTMSGGGPMADDLANTVDELTAGHVGGFDAGIRNIFFLYLLPAMGLLLVVPVAMAFRIGRRPREPDALRLARVSFLTFAIGAVCWGLILFGGSLASTVIHQGTLFIPLLGLVAAALGIRAVLPRFGAWLLGINCVLVLALYAPAFEPEPGTSYSFWMGLLAAAFLAGFCWVTFVRRTGEPAPVAVPGGVQIDSPS